MIVNAEVKFPVIQQTPNFILGSIKDPSQLLTVGEQNLKKGCFKNCRIVDSCGNEFRVISARKSKTEKLFRLWNLFPSYRLIKVDIELSESIKLDFDIFKEQVLSTMKSKKWVRSLDETEEEILLYLNKVTSFEDFICRVGVYS